MQTVHFISCIWHCLIKKAFFLVDLALYDFIDSHAPGLHARVYQNNFQELLLSFCHGFQGSSSSSHMYVASIMTHQIISVPLELTFTIIVTVNSFFFITLKTCFWGYSHLIYVYMYSQPLLFPLECSHVTLVVATVRQNPMVSIYFFLNYLLLCCMCRWTCRQWWGGGGGQRTALSSPTFI